VPLELLVVLSLVIVTALAFDFTNGFHDTGNAMAPSIATGALKPKTAVMLSALLNLIGAFLSVEVALTVTNAVVNLQDDAGAPRPELLGDGGESAPSVTAAELKSLLHENGIQDGALETLLADYDNLRYAGLPSDPRAERRWYRTAVKTARRYRQK